MTKSKKTDKLLPPVKIVEETKEKVENIKKDAKKYYRGKNLIIRYVFIGFLLILLALQFFLPSMKEQDNNDESQNNVTTSKVYDLETTMDFLGEEIDINIPAFDEAKATILSDKQQLLILYKKRPAFLAKYESAFKKAGLSTDYMYLAFLNGLSDNLWFLPGEAIEKYKLQADEYVDESYNADKTTQVAIDYLKFLEKKYNNPNLALMGYIMGSSALDGLMSEQGVETFDELYLEDYLSSWYYSVAAYKYIFEHISNYIDIENTTTYPIKDTKIIAVREIDDLASWSKENGYTIKEIKELNPWILGNSLPKGKWELEVDRD